MCSHFVYLHLLLCFLCLFLQLYRRSSHGKEHMIDLTSSLVSKRTGIHLMTTTARDSRLPWILRLSPALLRMPPLWWNVLYGLTPQDPLFPQDFQDKNWANLFSNFEDLIDELVQEIYSNAKFTRVELKCWVRGKEFIITLDYLAKILRITLPANVDISPYDDRLPPVTDILQILGVDPKVSAKGTSIGTGSLNLN